MNKFIILFFIHFFCFTKAHIEYDGWINVELFHDLGHNTEEYTYRTNISISSLNSGLFTTSQKLLSEDDIRNIKSLAYNNEFYRLKTIITYPNGDKRTFATGNRACSVLNDLLSDELWVAVDGNGYVNSIALSTTGCKSSDCCSDFSLAAQEFSTDVLIKHTEIAPVPDTASFIQKIEREREARERGEIKDSRSFLAKYWIYIVPVVILLFISGAANPEQPK